MNSVLRSYFRVVLVLIACAALAVGAFAQSAATGAIAGAVTDPTKAVVVGATVTVRNIETGAQQSATTDSTGRFRVVRLQPGIYSVTATAAKFAAPKQENIIVEVGRVSEIDVVLAVAGKTESVQVTAEAPVVNTEQHDFAHNINVAQINDLPINGRRWNNFALLTPGANTADNYGLIGFRGLSGIMNNSTVDGADNNQAFFGEERGRTRSMYVVSQSAVREFQVNTSNYSAEYGRAAGAVINTVTKSGTNSLHGTAFYYMRDNGFGGATNPFTTELVKQADGTYSSPIPFQPLDRRQQFGGNVGGPIVKDKLFFFFNYDGQRQNIPGTAMPAIPAAMFLCPPGQTCAANNPDGTAGNIFTASEWNYMTTRGVTVAQAYKAINMLQGTTGATPRRNDQDIFFPKLDWRVNQNHTISASYNRMRRFAPQDYMNASPVNSYAANEWGDDVVKVDMVNFRVSSALSSTLSNEFRASWGRDFEAAVISATNPAESDLYAAAATYGYRLAGGMLPDTYFSSGGQSYNFGNNYALPRAAYPDEHRFQFANTTNWSHGKHLLKWGGDITRVDDLNDQLQNSVGDYSYKYRSNWIVDYTNALKGTPSKNYDSVAFGTGQRKWAFHTWDYGIFVQDDWRVLPRLTLTFGLRWEYQQLAQPMIPNNMHTMPATMTPLDSMLGYPATTDFPTDKNNFAPRFGFALDVFGDGKTSLRGGYGMFYGRVVNTVLAQNLYGTGAVDPVTKQPLGQASYTWYTSTGGSPTYPNLPTGMSSTSPSVYFFAPNFQTPQVHQADLVLEHEIARNTVVSVSYLMSLGRELTNFLDQNINPAKVSGLIPMYFYGGGPFGSRLDPAGCSTAAGPGGWCITDYTSTAYGTSTYYHMFETVSNINSSYNALVAQVNRRMTNGLQFNASYTWSHALDNGQNSNNYAPSYPRYWDPNAPGLEYGNSSFDVRHRIVGSMVWDPQHFRHSSGFTKALLDGWLVAPIFTFNSGRAFTEAMTVGSTTGYVMLPKNVNYAWGSSINGSGGSNRAGGILGPNSWRYPWIQNIDLRVSRKFRLTERQNLEVLAEVFNLFNHMNVTDLNSQLYYMCGANTTPRCASSNGVSTTTNNPALGTVVANTFIYDPTFGTPTQAGGNVLRERQMQFAIRYTF